MAKRPKTGRVAATVPQDVKDGLERSAADNGRSLASEVRMACEHWLKANGRRA